MRRIDTDGRPLYAVGYRSSPILPAWRALSQEREAKLPAGCELTGQASTATAGRGEGVEDDGSIGFAQVLRRFVWERV